MPALGSVPNLALPAMSPAPGGGLLLLGLDVGAAQGRAFRFTGTEWQLLPAPPFALREVALAFDAVHGKAVAFGGRSALGAMSAQTWTFDGATWTLETPLTGRPVARYGASMAFDVRRGQVVMHGGLAASGPTNETLVWTGSDWLTATSVTVPPVFMGEAMAYDEARQEVVLLGAITNFNGPFQCWVYDGIDWTQRQGQVPQFGMPRLCYDRGRARVVARSLGSVAPSAEWDGRAWTSSTQAMPPLADLVLGYDEAQHAVFMLGGGLQYLWLAAPQPSAVAFGSPCQDPARVLRAAPGSVPALGRILRLEVDRGGSADLAVGVFGFSRTQAGGLALPAPVPILNPLQCLLRVDPLQSFLLPATDPAPWLVAVPNTAVLLGATADVQAGFLGSSQFDDTTNGLALRAGLVPVESSLREDFQTALARDPLASGDLWQGGVQAALVGGDGRHGSFDPNDGTQVAPSVFEFSTDSQTLAHPLAAQDTTVLNGEFAFTDFVVPAGVTVRFRGSRPVQLRVRGRIQIDGVLDANGAAITTFNSRNPSPALGSLPVAGQLGGLGGPGGGRGGQGGDRCLGGGNVTAANSGRDGQDLVVPAGHAYAGQQIGTGGRGSPIFPAHGIVTSPTMTFGMGSGALYNGNFTWGGGGGGFSQPGGVSVSLPGSGTTHLTLPATPPPGGIAFTLFPIPPGTSSLTHFLIGGSGGGGAGSQPFYELNLPTTPQFVNDAYKAGAGGTGGGGAVLLRSGGSCTIGSSGAIEVKGGAGVLINGDNPGTLAVNPDPLNATSSWGLAAPGGGGSGGSVLIQAHGAVAVLGRIDASGGTGSRAGGNLPADSVIDVRAGDGAPGFYRLESHGSIAVTGSGNVPAFNNTTQAAVLAEGDQMSGSRSVWLQPGTVDLPIYRRYELRVDLGSQSLLFSDDPARGPAADSGPVRLRFQSARLRADGTVDPASIGPWRDYLGSLRSGFGIGHDRGDVFRFDFAVDATAGVVPVVRSLAVFFQ